MTTAKGQYEVKDALKIANKIIDKMGLVLGENIWICGSLRRGAKQVGDIDLIAFIHYGIMFSFLKCGKVIRGKSGGTAASIITDGIQTDIMLTSPKCLGATLIHMTGPAEHNIQLRRKAKEQGYLLNQWGLWKGRIRIAGTTEAEIYTALKVPWVSPEQR